MSPSEPTISTDLGGVKQFASKQIRDHRTGEQIFFSGILDIPRIIRNLPTKFQFKTVLQLRFNPL
jgi:hypothetical protein